MNAEGMGGTFGPLLEKANLTSSGIVLVEEITYFLEFRYDLAIIIIRSHTET